MILLKCAFVSVFVLSVLCVFAVRGFNEMGTKFIEDLCSYEETKILLSTGNGAALRIKQNSLTLNSIALGDNCTILISSSGDGVILNLESSSYSDLFYKECEDYIQIFSDKKSTKLCGFKSSSFISEGNVKFTYYRKYDKPQWKFTVLATSYRKGNGVCSSNEFMCNSGECIGKEFRCDGFANCPDGSDEFSPRNSVCISIPHFTLKPIDFDWNLVFPTTKSILEYRKSFNVTLTAAVACAFLIFIFGVVRFVCHYHCSRQNIQRRHCTNLRTFSIIRPRPMFQSEYECSPPPSYVSLINDNSFNTAAGNPPAYSTVVLTSEENLADENKNLKNNVASELPPPPYEP